MFGRFFTCLAKFFLRQCSCLLSHPSCVTSSRVPFFKVLKLWLFFFPIFFVRGVTPDVTQPDCPPLALSPFFLSLLFPQKSHHFGVSAVRSHSHTVFCFNSVFMLSAHFPSLFISLLTFCSHTNLAGCPDSSCQWSRSESQRVCLPKDCLRGL